MKICNFCGKSQDKVKVMLVSDNGDICNECVLICMRTLIDNLEESKEIELKPIKIKRKFKILKTGEIIEKEFANCEDMHKWHKDNWNDVIML